MANLYDFSAESQRLAQKQRIADALTKGAMSPMETQQSGMFVTPTSNTQLFAKIAEGLLAMKGRKDFDKSTTEFGARSQQAMAEELEKYNKTRQGQKWQSGVLKPNADGSLQNQEIAPDPQKAVLDAISSSHPMMQQYGMMQQGHLNDMELKGSDNKSFDLEKLLPYADPNSIMGMMTGGLSNFKPKPAELKEVGGIIYDPVSRSTVQLDGPDPQLETIGGDLFEVNPSTSQRSKLDNAPQTTVNNFPAPPEDVFKRQVATKLGDTAVKQLEDKAAAQDLMNVVTKMEELNNSPMFSGPTANIATVLSGLAETIGLNSEEEAQKLANSETYASQLAQQIASYLTAGSGVGRSMSEGDRQAIEKQFPQLIQSPEGRARIIQTLKNSAERAIGIGNQVEAAIRQNYPDLGGVLSSSQAPRNAVQGSNSPAPVQAPAGPISWDEYMRRMQGGQ